MTALHAQQSRVALRRRLAPGRRGTVMFAVLFLVVIASLSAASMLTATAAERRAAVRSVEELELRLAVRSALSVYTAELARERDAMLSGETPATPKTLRLGRGEPDDDDPPPGITVELVPFDDGRVLIPEAARLDINAAPISALRAIPGLPQGLADAIDRGRRTSPFRSPAELLTLETNDSQGVDGSAPGIEADSGIDQDGDLFANSGFGTGTPSGLSADDDASVDDGTPFGTSGNLGEPFGDDPSNTPPSPFDDDSASSGTGWIDLLTVFSADPTVSAGSADPERTGMPCVNVNAPWSDRLERSLAEAAGDALDDSARTLFIDAPRLATPSVLLRLLVDNSVAPEDWSPLLDAITTTPDPFLLGLVDVNRAPAEVLATLPGLDSESAEAIVSARDRLDLADRRSIDWPFTQGIIEQDQFFACVDFLTTRTLQWRFRIKASFEAETDDFIGFDPGDAPADLLPESDEFGVAIEDEPEEDTGPVLIFDVVLDLAGDRPRIAYLRERTSYDLALAVMAIPGMNRGSRDAQGNERDRRESDLFGEVGTFGIGASTDNEMGSMDADRDRLAGDEDPFSDPDGFFTLGDDDGGSLWGDDEDDGSDDGSEGGASEERVPSTGSSSGGSSGGRDNRLGRWAPSRGPTPRRGSGTGDSPTDGGGR